MNTKLQLLVRRAKLKFARVLFLKSFYRTTVIPDNKTLKSFHSVILPLFEKVKYNTRQIQTLQATRDTLLPKLMSGQLRVAEFQEQLSEVM